jgi:hypothetical protein
MLRILNKDAIERRLRKLQTQRGEYIVPGPDFIWSIDGHDKLSGFGIEIYACIDAYSRMIIWIYVGIVQAIQLCINTSFIAQLQASAQSFSGPIEAPSCRKLRKPTLLSLGKPTQKSQGSSIAFSLALVLRINELSRGGKSSKCHSFSGGAYVVQFSWPFLITPLFWLIPASKNVQAIVQLTRHYGTELLYWTS